MSAVFAAARQNDAGRLDEQPHDQNGFADDDSVARRARGAAEVHAQVAVAVVVVSLAVAVRRVHAHRANEHDRGKDRDEQIATGTCAQGERPGIEVGSAYRPAGCPRNLQAGKESPFSHCSGTEEIEADP